MKMEETIGKRIARLRQQHNYTQEQLAERVAVSRVAVSHIEMDLSLPGERTVTLLAGVFKCSPPELVEGTTYPQAKAERLPLVACCYTEMELQLALLENDLAWVERLKETVYGERWTAEVRQEWLVRLGGWLEEGAERERVSAVRERVLGL
jgi:transcriptional regulator with XRE-family HTH domain